jgi:putative hydrolase of the HAD superfamily
MDPDDDPRMNAPRITTLFLDIGGVLLTPGWDRAARARAAKFFQLDAEEFEERHHLSADLYEVGRIDLAGYLERVVFHTQRRFQHDEFRKFMFAQSFPLTPMIEFARELRQRRGLRVVLLSNEGRELGQHRIQAFNLGAFSDVFVISGFVRCRKPDTEIYRMALDLAQVPPEHVAYVEDRPLFVETGARMGLHAIHHTGLETTRAALAELGLAAGA